MTQKRGNFVRILSSKRRSRCPRECHKCGTLVKTRWMVSVAWRSEQAPKKADLKFTRLPVCSLQCAEALKGELERADPADMEKLKSFGSISKTLARLEKKKRVRTSPTLEDEHDERPNYIY